MRTDAKRESSLRASTIDLVDSTQDFYEAHAQEYFNKTVTADLKDLYDRVLIHVKPGGRILDAGCGSGRDLKIFRSRGFDAVGVDASTALVKLAGEFSGASCLVMRFEDIEFDQAFDTVWACASLLHLPRRRLVPVLRRLRKSLVTRGIIFASFQAGGGETLSPDGRFFTYYEREQLTRLFERAGFAVIETWTAEDSLPDRSAIQWVNVLARRLELRRDDGGD